MEVKQGQIVDGTVTGIQPYGAFIKMDNGADGLVYIEDLSVARIKSPEERVKVGQKIKCMVKYIDEKTGKIVLESLVEANNKLKTTMIIVTHNPGIALIGDRIIKMNSGKIVEEKKNEKRTNPKDIPWG